VPAAAVGRSFSRLLETHGGPAFPALVPAIRHFRRLLTYTLFSRTLRRAERWLNWIVPKSMVFYFEKKPAASHAA